jgi:hypothetical protein
MVCVGDVVDVLAAPATDSQAGAQAVGKVVTTDAVVVLASAKQKVQAADSDRVVLAWRSANEAEGLVLQNGSWVAGVSENLRW